MKMIKYAREKRKPDSVYFMRDIWRTMQNMLRTMQNWSYYWSLDMILKRKSYLYYYDARIGET